MIRDNEVIKEEHLNRSIDELFLKWDSKETPGGSLAIIKDGKIIFSKGYGSANLEYHIPNTPKTIFNIASVSKQFTAFSIALLAEQEQINLEDDIRKYLPQLPNFGKKITIRNLVHHTSGLKDFFELLLMSGWLLEDVIIEKHIMETTINQRTLNFQPGEEFLYSNTGYILLAKIVEYVSGLKFSDWTQKNIFEPLKMNNSFFNDDYEGLVINRAYSYKQHKEGYKKEIHTSSIIGAGGLFTTVEDLAIWTINFDSLQIGTKKVMALMHQQGVLNNGKEIEYSFGQEITEYKGIPMVVHGGGIAGYRTYLCRFPDHNLAIIVLGNVASFNPREKAMHIADIYLRDIISTDTAQAKTKQETEGNIRISTSPMDNLETYTGRYKIADNFIFKIWVEKGVLKGHITGKKETHVLKPLSKNKFEIPAIKTIIEFEKYGDEELSQINLRYNETIYIAPKLASFNPENENLSEYKGQYFSKELQAFYNLKAHNNWITLQHQRGQVVKLKLVEPDYFTGTLVPRVDVNMKVIRDSNSVITGFEISSKRAKNVLFEKVK